MAELIEGDWLASHSDQMKVEVKMKRERIERKEKRKRSIKNKKSIPAATTPIRCVVWRSGAIAYD
jgi:hypothetical protein